MQQMSNKEKNSVICTHSKLLRLNLEVKPRGHLVQPPAKSEGGFSGVILSQLLNTSKKGNSTTFGNLFQCFKILITKRFFFSRVKKKIITHNTVLT